jgi:hypothetical protein
MFLCSWSTLCLNLPARGESRFTVFRRKIYMTGLSFGGPEFIFQIALGQLASARDSVKEFHDSGHEGWTLTHAFYADMGGYILKTADGETFPVDAKQLHYLVMKEYVKFPTTTKEMIKDKNKVDGLLRIVTIGQTLWFLINTAGRAIQHLAITCGELTTVAFIICSIGTTACWVHKPADVQTPEFITTTAKLSEILRDAGRDLESPYTRTPLDFVSRKEWPWSLYWSNWMNILRSVGIVFAPQSLPVGRFENTISRELTGGLNLAFLSMTAIYLGMFLCGWNFIFPTTTELHLWRSATVALMATLVAYWAVNVFAFNLYPAIERYLAKNRTAGAVAKMCSFCKEAEAQERGWFRSRVSRAAAWIRNNSVTQDPEMTVPLKAILPIYIVAMFYCPARIYLFIQDIIQLRSLPASAFVTVDWTSVLPHI